jgi:hypothetical protein
VTVVALALPAGNFAITSTVLANSNTTVLAQVECGLLAGGKPVDASGAFTYLAEPSPGDRGCLTQTGTVSLANPGLAEVVCRSTSTTGNYPEGAITAVQVGAIG